MKRAPGQKYIHVHGKEDEKKPTDLTRNGLSLRPSLKTKTLLSVHFIRDQKYVYLFVLGLFHRYVMFLFVSSGLTSLSTIFQSYIILTGQSNLSTNFRIRLIMNIGKRISLILWHFTKIRGHPGSNRGPLDLQSNALPLSYIPFLYVVRLYINFYHLVYLTQWHDVTAGQMEITKQNKQS